MERRKTEVDMDKVTERKKKVEVELRQKGEQIYSMA